MLVGRPGLQDVVVSVEVQSVGGVEGVKHLLVEVNALVQQLNNVRLNSPPDIGRVVSQARFKNFDLQKSEG